MTRQTVEEYKTRAGGAYRTNAHAEVAASGTLSLHIENPPDSGVNVVLTAIKITAMGSITVRRPYQATYTTGTDANVANKSVGSGKDTAVNVYEGSTFSNESFVVEEYIGDDDADPGVADNAFGGGVSDLLGIVMEGNDVLIEVENRDTEAAHDASITIEYYESRTK